VGINSLNICRDCSSALSDRGGKKAHFDEKISRAKECVDAARYNDALELIFKDFNIQGPPAIAVINILPFMISSK